MEQGVRGSTLLKRRSQQTSSTIENYELREFGCASANFGTVVARDAYELAYTVNSLTCGRGLDYQGAVLKKFLEQPLLQSVLPEMVVKRLEREQCRVVCNGIAEAWSELKYCCTISY
jgi:hypothetical protein